MVTAIIDASYGIDKMALMTAFDERDIDARPFFSPLFDQPAFAGRSAGKRFVKANNVGHDVLRKILGEQKRRTAK
jgi:hypothetical protein